MKKTTKLLSFLLALTLIIGVTVIAPVTASAEDEQDYSYYSLYLPNEYGDLAFDTETGVPLELYQLIERLNRQDKVTVIMISHDISSAVRYASHILHIGKKVFFGTKEEYRESDLGRYFLSQEGGEG